jgi:hypothetical protein
LHRADQFRQYFVVRERSIGPLRGRLGIVRRVPAEDERHLLPPRHRELADRLEILAAELDRRASARPSGRPIALQTPWTVCTHGTIDP